jgi:hypothetical protein
MGVALCRTKLEAGDLDREHSCLLRQPGTKLFQTYKLFGTKQVRCNGYHGHGQPT